MPEFGRPSTVVAVYRATSTTLTTLVGTYHVYAYRNDARQRRWRVWLDTECVLEDANRRELGIWLSARVSAAEIEPIVRASQRR